MRRTESHPPGSLYNPYTNELGDTPNYFLKNVEEWTG